VRGAWDLCLAVLNLPRHERVLAHASALLAFWSGAICLGWGALWIVFVLSVSYVSQHRSIAALLGSCGVRLHIDRCCWLPTAVWNLTAALLACLNPPLLPLL
jgi:hypothetical protein